MPSRKGGACSDVHICTHTHTRLHTHTHAHTHTHTHTRTHTHTHTPEMEGSLGSLEEAPMVRHQEQEGGDLQGGALHARAGEGRRRGELQMALGGVPAARMCGSVCEWKISSAWLCNVCVMLRGRVAC